MEAVAKICIPSETKDINVEVFNMILKKNEVKTLVKFFLMIINSNSIVKYLIQKENGIIIQCV